MTGGGINRGEDHEKQCNYAQTARNVAKTNCSKAQGGGCVYWWMDEGSVVENGQIEPESYFFKFGEVAWLL